MPNEINIPPSPIPEINDLIGNPPSWLLRSGITMVALVSILVLTLAFYIKYPEKIQGTAMLSSSSPPIELVSQTQGYIESVLLDEGSQVSEGDAIFYIKNTTNPEQIQVLQSFIEDYEAINDPRKYLNIYVPQDLQLGSLQGDYASLSLKYNELQQTLKHGIPFQQINNISEEIIKIRSLNASQRREKEIYQSELALEEKDYNRNKSLEKDGVISTQELEKANTVLLQKQRQYESMENAIIQNNIRIEQLELEKLKIQGNRANLIKSYQFAINEIIARIRSNIEHWNQTFTIKAPISGRLSIKNQYYQNAVVNQGDVIGHILPESHQQNVFICQLPIQNTGKLEAGQKALLRLDAYPYKEYGMVISKLHDISKIPLNDQEGKLYYEVKINVKDTITTDLGHEIPYKPNMTASVDIITKDKSVLERIFDQLYGLVRERLMNEGIRN